MDFTEYLWSLTLGVMRKIKNTESDVYKVLNAVGNVLEDAKEAIFIVRRQGIISTAKGRALDLHGEGRKVIRYAGETDEQYRKRILSKKEIARMGGTAKGVVYTAQSMGYVRAEHVPMFKYDKERWSKFYLYIDKELMNQLNNFEILKKEVANVKKAGSYPLYVFTYYRGIAIKTDIEVGTSTQRYTCGKLKCGQTYGRPLGVLNSSSLNINPEFKTAPSEIRHCANIVSGSDKELQYLGSVIGTELRLNPDVIDALATLDECGTIRAGSSAVVTNESKEIGSEINLTNAVISAKNTNRTCSKSLKSGVM